MSELEQTPQKETSEEVLDPSTTNATDGNGVPPVVPSPAKDESGDAKTPPAPKPKPVKKVADKKNMFKPKTIKDGADKSESPKDKAGQFRIVSPLNYEGKRLKNGTVVTLDLDEGEIASLIALNIIKPV